MAALLCPGERLVRSLSGGDIDHVSFGTNLGYWPWGETMERWRRETGRSDLDLAREFDYEAGFAAPAVEYGVWPHFEERTLESTAEHVVTRDWRGITMRNRHDRSSMPEFLDYPVKDANDWEQIKTERLRLEDADRRVTQDWAQWRARLAQTGEAVQVGSYPWGVFGTLRDLMGVEALLIGFYTEPDLIRDMMDHLTTLWLALYERVARHVPIDHVHIWEDMSGRQGSLISPAMVESFMMPCYDRIRAFARAHGVRIVSVDTDGDCSELVPIMKQHGISMFFPFEVQAGNDVEHYRRQYPDLGIMCGLDKRALAGTRADIDQEMARAERMVQQGRYVPGFDHLIPPDVPWDNMRYAVQQLRRVCRAA
jgi:uroporphyrinogen decarboxylase